MTFNLKISLLDRIMLEKIKEIVTLDESFCYFGIQDNQLLTINNFNVIKLWDFATGI